MHLIKQNSPVCKLRLPQTGKQIIFSAVKGNEVKTVGVASGLSRFFILL